MKIKLLILLSCCLAGFISNAQKIVKDEVGNSYTGPFVSADFSGEGTCVYANGSKYTGSWKEGIFQGKGSYTWSNGDSYSGQWVNGERHGKGTMVTASKEKVEGTWVNDELQGKIFWYNAKKELIYEGDWQNNQPHGIGKQRSSATELYEGGFENGSRTKGSLRVSIGTQTIVYTGKFSDDEIISGIIQYPDGSSYEGAIKDRIPNGKGVYQLIQNGVKLKSYNGIWINGKLVQAREFTSRDTRYAGLFSTMEILEAALRKEPAAMYKLAIYLTHHKEYEAAITWLQVSADSGYGPALFKLGQAYIDAEWVKEDKQKALGLKFKAIPALMAAEKESDDEVWLCLGLHYAFTGQYPRALELLKKAAGQKNGEALMGLGALYENGYGVPKDLTESEKWFIAAANTNNLQAIHYLADQYANGTFEKNKTQQANWLGKAALNGSAAAYFELGELFHNEEKAIRFFLNSANLGHKNGMYRAANYYLYGFDIIKPDFSKGMEMMEAAVKEGSIDAMLALADGYRYARKGFNQNTSLAFQYLEMAANNGSLKAMEELGVGLLYPLYGVTPNYTKALQWLHKGAALGSGTCMNYIGAAYTSGLGVPKNEATGVSWYKKAAEAGDPLAMSNLSDAYKFGTGVKKDKTMAAYWQQRYQQEYNKKP